VCAWQSQLLPGSPARSASLELVGSPGNSQRAQASGGTPRGPVGCEPRCRRGPLRSTGTGWGASPGGNSDSLTGKLQPRAVPEAESA